MKVCERCIESWKVQMDGRWATMKEWLEFHRNASGRPSMYKIDGDGIWYGMEIENEEKWVRSSGCRVACPYELERMMEDE